MVVKNLPSSVRLDVQIFIAGVLFADDLTTERSLTVADFDTLGEYTFLMIHPNTVLASTCHTIYLFQGSEYIGECYYRGTMPQELRHDSGN